MGGGTPKMIGVDVDSAEVMEVVQWGTPEMIGVDMDSVG